MADVKKSNLHTGTGIPNVTDACIVLVKTEWNVEIVNELEKGCLDQLKKHGIKKISTITVPGSFEIPFAIKNHWENAGKKKKPDAFIAIGCVIRGDTPHFEYISKAVTDGIAQLNLLLPVPVIFGVLTVNTLEQALERIGGLHGHKGEEAAISALKMISLTIKK